VVVNERVSIQKLKFPKIIPLKLRSNYVNTDSTWHIYLKYDYIVQVNRIQAKDRGPRAQKNTKRVNATTKERNEQLDNSTKFDSMQADTIHLVYFDYLAIVAAGDSGGVVGTRTASHYPHLHRQQTH